MMQTEANRLMERAQDGDKKAADRLVEMFYENIYAFLRRLCANDADAADLTQRTFTKVWQSLATFSGRSSVGSWIHSIAYHTCLDWRRRNHRVEVRSPEWWDEQISGEPRPDEVAIRDDLTTGLFRAVDHLEPDLRDTLHLHYYQELTLEETAEAMNVATSTVKYRLRQALNQLVANFNSERVLSNSSGTCRIL